MYAVIVTGGKQYRVMQGETLKVEKIDLEEGKSFEIDKVLMLGDGDKVKVGAPTVDGAKVTASTRSASSSSVAASTIASRWATGSTSPKSKSPASPAKPEETTSWHRKKA